MLSYYHYHSASLVWFLSWRPERRDRAVVDREVVRWKRVLQGFLNFIFSRSYESVEIFSEIEMVVVFLSSKTPNRGETGHTPHVKKSPEKVEKIKVFAFSQGLCHLVPGIWWSWGRDLPTTRFRLGSQCCILICLRSWWAGIILQNKNLNKVEIAIA